MVHPYNEIAFNLKKARVLKHGYTVKSSAQGKKPDQKGHTAKISLTGNLQSKWIHRDRKQTDS
jgi:hypothetical protein